MKNGLALFSNDENYSRNGLTSSISNPNIVLKFTSTNNNSNMQLGGGSK